MTYSRRQNFFGNSSDPDFVDCNKGLKKLPKVRSLIKYDLRRSLRHCISCNYSVNMNIQIHEK